MSGNDAPTAELAQLIALKPDLVRGICAFNQSPADYIDEPRRAEFFPQHTVGGSWHNIWECDRSRRHLSRHILERLSAQPCLEPARREWPLALLPRPAIDRLARHVAAALVGARVRRCVSRNEVLQWREWLSQDAHEFALTRAGLLPFNADAGSEPRSTTAQELGYAWIVAASRQWHESISRRFMLKLPAGPYREADAVDGASAARLVQSVLSIVEARWCSSFATMRA